MSNAPPSLLPPHLNLALQITALCVSVAPLWSLTVALYKYPARRRRQERHRARLRDSNAPDAPPNPFDAAAPMSRRTRHVVRPSDASSDEYEMYNMPAGSDSYVRVLVESESPPPQKRALGREGVRRSLVRGPRPIKRG